MKYEQLSDIELLRLLEGDNDRAACAFRCIYKKYSAQIMSYCRNMIRNDATAEDIFQETFIKFYKNARPGLNNNSIQAFLTIIARNLCYDYFRTRKYNIPIENCDLDVFENISGYEENDGNEKKYELMIESMELLSPDDKEMLVFRIYNKMSYEEIADIIGTNESNARKKVFRAKMKLKKIIEPYYPIFK